MELSALRAWWSRARGQVAADVSVGIIVGLIAVILSLSYGVLIFSGRLAPYLSRGIALALLGSVILCLVVVLGSSHPLGLASAQEIVAVVLAGAGSSLTGLLVAHAPQRLLPTVLVTIALASVVSGLSFFAVGALRVGRLIRFVPYPVISGFLAGTGWQVVAGALVVMAGPLGTRGVFAWVLAGAVRVAPGLLVAGALLVLTRRVRHYLVMPTTLLVALGLFYLVVWLAHLSLARAGSAGWLLGPFPSGALWRLPNPGILTQVDWRALAAQTGSLVALVTLSAIALLLNVTSLEVALHQDLDLDRELRVAGVANVLAGLGGGLGGYHLLTGSLLARRAGGRTRLVGIVAAATVALTLVVGTALLAAVPRFVLGGLLLFVGLDLLVEWLYATWFRVSHAEYGIIVLITLVIGLAGFLQGILVGLVAALLLFAVQYSRISAIQRVLSGAVFHSNVDRPLPQQQMLQARGEQTAILELQGFLFFGSAAGLVDEIRHRLEDATRLPLRYLILDFRRVTGIDSSAALSFTKLRQLLRTHDVLLVVTHLAPQLERLLRLGAGDGDPAGDAAVQRFPDLDRGVEWCEERVLEAEPAAAHAEGHAEGPAGEGGLAPLVSYRSGPIPLSRLMPYLDRLTLGAGEPVIRQGDPADALYIVESGRVTTILELPDGGDVRLLTAGAGTLIGEVGWYRGAPRSASVVAAEPTVIYRLTTRALQTMREREPDLAADLHESVAGILAERVARTTTGLATLLE